MTWWSLAQDWSWRLSPVGSHMGCLSSSGWNSLLFLLRDLRIYWCSPKMCRGMMWLGIQYLFYLTQRTLSPLSGFWVLIRRFPSSMGDGHRLIHPITPPFGHLIKSISFQLCVSTSHHHCFPPSLKFHLDSLLLGHLTKLVQSHSKIFNYCSKYFLIVLLCVVVFTSEIYHFLSHHQPFWSTSGKKGTIPRFWEVLSCFSRWIICHSFIYFLLETCLPPKANTYSLAELAARVLFVHFTHNGYKILFQFLCESRWSLCLFWTKNLITFF